MDWYRQYCGYALSSRMGKDPMPAFDALACYKLRCELLHNGDAIWRPNTCTSWMTKGG